MTARTALAAGGAMIMFAAAAGWYAHQRAAPACDSDRAQRGVFEVMRDRFHRDSIFLHNIQTTSGGFFAEVQDCTADVAEIRGNIDAADMPWQHIRYRIARPAGAEHVAVTVNPGDAAPFANQPVPTLWSRLLAHL